MAYIKETIRFAQLVSHARLEPLSSRAGYEALQHTPRSFSSLLSLPRHGPQHKHVSHPPFLWAQVYSSSEGADLATPWVAKRRVECRVSQDTGRLGALNGWGFVLCPRLLQVTLHDHSSCWCRMVCIKWTRDFLSTNIPRWKQKLYEKGCPQGLPADLISVGWF